MWNALIIISFTFLTAVLAQVSISLDFTPVPITGQTLGVLLSGIALGANRGALSQILYWLLGMIGFPIYAGGAGGWETATGPTMGYFVGFILTAAILGRLAELGFDRTILSSVCSMIVGSMVIYLCGASWLATSLDIPLAFGHTNAISIGVSPFLIGDSIKICFAVIATSMIWKLILRNV